MNINEIKALTLFLNGGYSTRKIDTVLEPDNKKPKGWISWDILKKYYFTNSDKQRLYLFTEAEIKKILISISASKGRSQTEDILSKASPGILSKYKDAYLAVKSDKGFADVLSGEARNIILYFFKNKKLKTGRCQYRNCLQTNLDTVHLSESRQKLLILAANKSIIGKINNLIIFDIYNAMSTFLQFHSRPKSICFLCKKHHQELHRVEKISNLKYLKYMKEISWKR